jgi:hypothetical protein
VAEAVKTVGKLAQKIIVNFLGFKAIFFIASGKGMNLIVNLECSGCSDD